ncbi:GumC family protein [Bosea rubneri]|jgi:succinoglycan biosynthesis transport protein ExoP|uniref:GumC family protein n=1 Tax=Bosea rubneri TaxID=3075434 RepID=A0ABU3S118_9HYPH|nr:GumC family protein [Bosea sp. ZW T0_25]MDU0338473.1 GumC family protein [Bosea sp. ZW T0_25]
MYGPKESEQRQTPRPVGQSRGARTAADFVVGSDGTAAVASRSPLARIGQLARIGVDDVLAWLRDGIGWIIGAIVVCLVGALLYAATTPPRYTVFTDILIDPSNLNVVRDDVFTSNPQRDAQLLEVESKLRILTSRNVLSRVIDKLDLTSDPEFVKPGLLTPLWNLISPAEVARDNRLAVMRALSERVDARREERSFVVVMRFWAEDPEKAVVISNAIVDAFEAELFQSSAESAGRVVKNLNNRLDELRRNVTEAEQRVEDFRRSKGLQLNNGEPVSARLSSELNTQVLDAQQRFIQAETRYRQMSAAIAERRTTSAAIFDSATMVSLRAQLNQLQQQIGSIRATFGTRHPQMVTALSEQQAIEAALVREARRILDGARAEFERERSNLATLRSKASDEKSNVFSDNEEQVQLRDLQRDARAKAALYETHLARTQQISERQQIDTSNVRVISRPVPPKARSWPPRTLILLGAAVFLGLLLGVSIALGRGAWRYLRDPRLATA